MGKRKHDSATTSGSLTTSAKSSFKYANLQADDEDMQTSKSNRKQQRKDSQQYSVKSEEGQVLETKVGTEFLGDDERPYLKAIKDELALAVQNLSKEKEKLNDDATQEEDDRLSFGIIWNRIKGREVLIAKDKELSFILENLMRLTGTAGLSHAISTFVEQSEEKPSLLQDLVSHSCASHIIEEVFERIAVLPSSEDISLDRFIDFLLVNPSIYTDNPYAAHVAEKMLLRLCRIVSYKVEEGHVHFTIYDSKVGMTQNVAYHKDDTTKFAAAVSDALSSSNQKILRKVVGVFENLLDPPKDEGGLSRNFWRSAAGSVVLQALLVTLVAYHTSKQHNSDETSSSRKKSDDTLLAIPFVDKLCEKLSTLAMDKYGSRLAELLVALAPSASYLQLINIVSSAEFDMDAVIQDGNAHHVLIKLVEFCTDIPLLLLLTKTLCEKLDVILSSGHGMILVALAKKLADGAQKKAMCGRHGSASEWNQCQTIFLASLKKSYSEHGPQGWTEEQKKDYFVIVVGALYPKNFRKDPKVTAQNICMPGSQIVQSLCLFKENATVNNSFLKLNPELLAEYSASASGSYAIEKVLSTQKSQKNFFQSFIKNLIDISADLAISKFGSRTFDNLWKTVDLKNRQLLVDQLIPVQSKLRTNEFGRFLLNKLNLGLYRRSVEAWRNQQLVYEKQKSDLRSILEMTGKKKQ